MANQLTIKGYLRRWNAQLKQQEAEEEIRRFAIDYDVSSSYEYLLAKITSVFPGLVNKSITLYWKDADNDMIAFSSDDELMEAMRGISDNLFRVYIVEKAPAAFSTSAAPPQQPSGQENLLHFGVTCDGCEGPIYGNRYKCTVCPDYDLCSGCKGLGLHPEHQMRTIATPVVPWPFGGQCQFAGNFAPPSGQQSQQMPPPPPPYGAFYPPGPPPPAAGPQGFPDFPGGFPGQDCNPAQMHRMQRRAWKRWFRDTYGEDHKRKMKKERKEQKREEKKQRKAAGANPDAANKSSSSSSSDSEGDASPGTAYLKNVGQSVAAMLDPLGIDVQVDVESPCGQRRRCHRGMGGMRGPGGWGWHGGFRGGCGPWGGMGGGRGRWGGGPGGPGCPWRMRFSAANGGPGSDPAAPATPPTAPSEPTPAGSSEPMQQQQQQSECQQQHSADTNSETGEMASGQFNGNDQGWTLVNNGSPIADVEEATDGVEELHLSAPPPAAESVPLMPLRPSMPADPKVAEAVEQMTSMGYSNDGGWLTQLLVAHKGDIGRALDAIHAKK